MTTATVVQLHSRVVVQEQLGNVRVTTDIVKSRLGFPSPFVFFGSTFCEDSSIFQRQSQLSFPSHTSNINMFASSTRTVAAKAVRHSAIANSPQLPRLTANHHVRYFVSAQLQNDPVPVDVDHYTSGWNIEDIADFKQPSKYHIQTFNKISPKVSVTRTIVSCVCKQVFCRR